MKKITTILIAIVIVAIFASSSVLAQTKGMKYNQSISANPLGLVFGVFNATYEQQIAPKNSFTINGSYFTYNDWTAGSIGGSYRFYLLQEDVRAIQGFSFGPMAQIAFWSWGGPGSYSYDGGTVFYIGAEAAYKWVFSGGFVVEPSIALRFGVNQLEGLGGFSSYGIGVNLGYAW